MYRYTVQDIADAAGVSYQTAYKHVKALNLKSKKVKNVLLFEGSSMGKIVEKFRNPDMRSKAALKAWRNRKAFRKENLHVEFTHPLQPLPMVEDNTNKELIGRIFLKLAVIFIITIAITAYIFFFVR